jgi:sugar transferase (PEP-CTERM/EpsH1 system associated)
VDILFLCHRIPYPPDKGDKIRSHAMLRHLAKKHRVHLACFVDDPADFAHVDRVRAMAGGECLFVPLRPIAKFLAIPRAVATGEPVTTAYFGSARISRWIDSLASRYAIGTTVIFSSAMARYLLDGKPVEPACALLDLVDIDSDKWRQYAAQSKGLRRWIYGREATALLRLERRAARRFGATVLVSRYESDSFAALAPESASRIGVLANGVDGSYFAPQDFPNPYKPGEIPIAMTGRMDYEPNIDAAKWFLAEIMPRLQRSLPNLRFYAVGARPPRSLRALIGSAFQTTGYVADVRPYLQHAAAVVAPLRIARGVQNKVLEAMAMARPVVATTAATRALDAVANIHLWIEDRPEAFAKAVVAAATGSQRDTIRKRARDFVETHHSWTEVLSGLDDIVAGLTAPHVAAAPGDVPSVVEKRTEAVDLLQ